MSFENFTQVLQVFKAIIVKRIISLFEDISYALIIYHLRDREKNDPKKHLRIIPFFFMFPKGFETLT